MFNKQTEKISSPENLLSHCGLYLSLNKDARIVSRYITECYKKLKYQTTKCNILFSTKTFWVLVYLFFVKFYDKT